MGQTSCFSRNKNILCLRSKQQMKIAQRKKKILLRLSTADYTAMQSHHMMYTVDVKLVTKQKNKNITKGLLFNIFFSNKGISIDRPEQRASSDLHKRFEAQWVWSLHTQESLMSVLSSLLLHYYNVPLVFNNIFHSVLLTKQTKKRAKGKG